MLTFIFNSDYFSVQLLLRISSPRQEEDVLVEEAEGEVRVRLSLNQDPMIPSTRQVVGVFFLEPGEGDEAVHLYHRTSTSIEPLLPNRLYQWIDQVHLYPVPPATKSADAAESPKRRLGQAFDQLGPQNIVELSLILLMKEKLTMTFRLPPRSNSVQCDFSAVD